MIAGLTKRVSGVASHAGELMQAATLTDAGVAIATARGIVYKQYFCSGGNASA